MAKLVGSEITTNSDGSKSVSDTFMQPNGTLYVNTYNVTADGTKHDHYVTDEHGNYRGGHGEESKPWSERSRDPNSTFTIDNSKK